MKKTWKVKLWRYFIISLVGAYLILPIYSMADFSTKPFNFFDKGRTLAAWKMIPKQDDLAISLFRSLIMAAIVMAVILVIIVPTVIWVELRLPKLKRPLELLCLIPLAIPAIVIVVGIAPIYRWISIHMTESPIMLTGVYSMLILPYTYRSLAASLDSSDIRTLAEAAQTLATNGQPTQTKNNGQTKMSAYVFEGQMKRLATDKEEDERLEKQKGSWKVETPWKKVSGSGTVVDKSGAKHTPMSRARDLARKAFSKVQEQSNVKPNPFTVPEIPMGQAPKKKSRQVDIVREARNNAMKKKKEVTEAGSDKFQPDPELTSQITKSNP